MATVGVSTSNNVYVLSKEHGWVPARVIEYQDENNSKCVVQIPQYKEENDIQSDGGKHARGTKQEVISLKVYPNKTLPLQNVDDNGVLNQVEDMVDLPFLHEVSPGYNNVCLLQNQNPLTPPCSCASQAAILYNLKARHVQCKPYTRTGDIVIAVNPYQWMMQLYSEQNRTLYAQTLIFDGTLRHFFRIVAKICIVVVELH